MAQRISGYARQPDDVYETPAWVTRIIAPVLRFHASHLWDPANGPESKIAQALAFEGFLTTASNSDFFAHRKLPSISIDGICTNPPYGFGGRTTMKFIEHALELAPVVAMLLPIDYDSGRTRVHLFRDCKAFALKLVLLDRIKWFEGASEPSTNHCWCLWRRSHRGAARLAYAARLLTPPEGAMAARREPD